MEFQQNKRPRIGETEDSIDLSTTLLTLQHKDARACARARARAGTTDEPVARGSAYRDYFEHPT
eukprot:8198289-Heterocapsa_arctica.AAC.1